MKLKDLKTNPQNPRYLTEADFQKLLNKILTYPRLLEKNKITYDSEQGNVILGGNMRFKALNYICDTYTRENIFDAIKTAQNALNIDSKELLEESLAAYSNLINIRKLPENWVQDAKGLTAEEKEAFVIIDNVSDGKWDFDVLANEWDIDTYDWGLVDWKTEDNEDSMSNQKEYAGADPDSELYNFLNSEIKRLYLAYDSDTFEKVVAWLSQKMKDFDCENYSQAILKFIENDTN